MSGAFITLEGVEGVGKTTCTLAVQNTLSAAGHDVVLTREPGGTPLGERIRKWVLDGDHPSLSSETEALLMFAARANHLDEVIRPALVRGRWVGCDRFTDATIAYQGGGRGVDAGWLDSLKAGVQRGLEPDLTLLLDAPVEVGLARISDRKQDHFERESLSFFERVRAAYLELAETDPTRIKVIDASQPIANVEAQLRSILADFLRGFGDSA